MQTFFIQTNYVTEVIIGEPQYCFRLLDGNVGDTFKFGIHGYIITQLKIVIIMHLINKQSDNDR